MTGVGWWTVAGLPWLPPCAGICTLRHLIPSSSIGDEFNKSYKVEIATRTHRTVDNCEGLLNHLHRCLDT